MLKSNRNKNILSRPFIKDEKELKEIFETYEFERIVYFSNYLTMHGRMAGELEQLRQILQLCKKNKEIRMLYLTGQESIYNITSGKTLLVSAAENVVMEYGNMYQINTKILRIPHLYSALYTQDFFYKLFTEAEQSGKIVFEESPEQNIYFLCMDDLAELLYKVYDNWGKECCLNVPDCFGQNFSDLEKEIRKTIPGKLDIRYQNSGQIYKVQPDDQIIRQEYGWFPKISVFEDIPGMYQEYKKLSDSDSGLHSQLCEPKINGRQVLNFSIYEKDYQHFMLLRISYLHEQLQGELFERREGRESYRIHQEGCFLGFMGRPIKYDADRNEHEW